MAERFRVVSPHLDDAVLSCGRFALEHRGSRFLTVFAGGPDRIDPLPPFDRASRFFRDGDDVVTARRSEDARACEMLGAVPEHLDFWDGHYRTASYGYSGPSDGAMLEEIVGRLGEVAREDPVDAWLVPLGLGHPDHRLVSDACLSFLERSGDDVYAYADLPYFVEEEADARRRIADLASRGLTLTEVAGWSADASTRVKRDAIRAHRSQRRSLGRRARRAARATERGWAVQVGRA
ncbi:MAG: PIG-L family deacetylase [Actinomycetota bacterium]|nr:PIG-L family deacetylase [Actinomycetota bacterium]